MRRRPVRNGERAVSAQYGDASERGGRVFFSHLHFYWLNHGSAALQSTADYIGVGPDLPQPITGYVNTTFPKGAAMSQWLVNVGATPTASQLQTYQGQFSVTAVNPPTEGWISVPKNPNDSQMRPSIQYMTFNTPVEADAAAQCGRAVFTDLHMFPTVGDAGGDSSDPAKPFPSGCKDNGLTPQAAALEFVFFDLSACVQSDTATPTPPPPLAPPPSSPLRPRLGSPALRWHVAAKGASRRARDQATLSRFDRRRLPVRRALRRAVVRRLRAGDRATTPVGQIPPPSGAVSSIS